MAQFSMDIASRRREGHARTVLAVYQCSMGDVTKWFTNCCLNEKGENNTLNMSETTCERKRNCVCAYVYVSGIDRLIGREVHFKGGG